MLRNYATLIHRFRVALNLTMKARLRVYIIKIGFHIKVGTRTRFHNEVQSNSEKAWIIRNQTRKKADKSGHFGFLLFQWRRVQPSLSRGDFLTFNYCHQFKV